MHKGLVVLDVDGVLLKDIFLKRILQSKGPVNYLKILWLGIKYYINKITINKVLEEGYKLANELNVKKVQVTADKIKRVMHIKETIDILHSEGYYVSIISAGIPNFILKNLSEEIGADHYRGIDIGTKGATIQADQIRMISKIEIVEDLLNHLELSWDDVISVGDDPNNVELLKRSRLGIGFNPSQLVRKFSDIVIEGNNFLEILPYFIPYEKLPKHVGKKRFFWKRELFRKGVHLLGCIFPFIAHSNKNLAVSIMSTMIVLYSISEIFRYIGVSFSPFTYITRRAQRHVEKRGIIVGPVLLGLGMLLTILFFNYNEYLPAILIVSISDTLSALVGLRYGKIHILNLKNRTLLGSLAFFLSACIILLFTSGPRFIILPLAVLASLIELIPIYNLDNLLIPIGVALFLRLTNGG